MANEMRDKINKSRADMYRFLSGLYLMEVDAEQLKALKAMRFPEITGDEDADLDLAEGYGLMAKAIEATEEADLDMLAVDYAKTFLAAGEAKGNAAFPYESVYTGKNKEISGRATQEMMVLYAAKGLEMRKDTFKVMEDHVGLEMEYMSKLCMEEGFEAQKKFFKDHLVNWVKVFAADAADLAGTDFYKGLANITRGFIKKEQAFFKEGGALWDTK